MCIPLVILSNLMIIHINSGLMTQIHVSNPDSSREFQTYITNWQFSIFSLISNRNLTLNIAKIEFLSFLRKPVLLIAFSISVDSNWIFPFWVPKTLESFLNFVFFSQSLQRPGHLMALQNLTTSYHLHSCHLDLNKCHHLLGSL